MTRQHDNPTWGQTESGEPGSLEARLGLDLVHRVHFTRDALDPGNRTLHDLLPGSPSRTIVFIDDGLFEACPELPGEFMRYATEGTDRITIVEDPMVVQGGEAAKHDMAVVNEVLEAIDRASICRQSFVIGIGGGAMLDAVGFATATAHRGVRHIRFPTTTLSQNDAGIGVKNGINAFAKKNFTGCFAVPWAVINDAGFLHTLPDRPWRAGFSEAVKVGLLKDALFFQHLSRVAGSIARRDEGETGRILRHAARLHFEHIVRGGDPFETQTARPLDFGHWSAHRIEVLSGYTVLHGEAVAMGIALDSIYARRTGMLPAEDMESILTCLQEMGFALSHPSMLDPDAILAGLKEFQEHLGGQLTITLIEGIGKPVDVHEIDAARMRKSIQELLLRGDPEDAQRED